MLPTRKTSLLINMLLTAILLLLGSSDALGQYFDTGQEPASVRWRQLNTEHYKLVFPDYYEARARLMASYLDTVHQYAPASLAYQPKKITLWFHTQSATSNALVAWAPRRIEFYTTPPQDMYAQPWLEQLALHEYRHVVQIEKLNQGFTRGLSWIFGEQGTAAILGLYVPPWFLEGDAVATETGLSRSGRGRVPAFSMGLRAQLLDKGSYSYDKATMGSYRDHIPDAYELGYHIVTEARRNYGPGIWEHTLNRVARRPYMVTPFQKGIRDVSGKRKVPFYEECMSGLQQQWAIQDRHNIPQLLAHISPGNGVYTNYNHPKVTGDTCVIALKKSLDDIARIVRVCPGGDEEVVFTPGFIKTESLSYASGKLCWAETRADLRWDNRSYTVIRILDLETGKTRTISKRQRLFAPALSPDASRIAAVKTDSIDNFYLVILDAEGNITREIDPGFRAFPLTPAWIGSDSLLVVTVTEKGKNIMLYDLANRTSETLLPAGFTEIAQPVWSRPLIYFTAAYSGISNIYAFNLRERNVHRITSSRFGASDPELSGDGRTLYFSDYTADGSRIVAMPLAVSEWLPLGEVTDRSLKLYETLAAQEDLVPPLSSMPPSAAPSKKYSRAGHLFNFHSWAPVDINASSYDLSPGVSVMSQNLLSSSFLTAGWRYDVNEQFGKYYLQYTYAGWFPLIDIEVDHGLRRGLKDSHHEGVVEYKWRETNLGAGFRLPFNLSRGKYFRSVQLSSYAYQTIRRMLPESGLQFNNPDVFSMAYNASAYNQVKSNFRDIYPRWGQRLAFHYRHTPFQGSPGNWLAGVTGSIYLPGFFRHQGLHVYAGYQKRAADQYKFADVVAYPRGIVHRQDEELISVRTTYAFPLAYPDWSIGPVIYLKRIRAAAFYDYAIGMNHEYDRYYNSMGADLLVDVHLLRFVAPFEFGLRSIYLPDENEFTFQFLFGVDFNSFYVGD